MTNRMFESVVLAAWMPQGWDWIVLLAIILLLFGHKRLPQLSRAIGRSIRDFRKGLNEVRDEIENAGEEDEERDRPRPEPKAQAPKNSRPDGEASDKAEKDD